MKVGIALGGGGAKGLAHIGVMEALEEMGIRLDYVAGTSIGAIVGAIYCLDGDTRHLREITKNIIESEEFRKLGLDKFYTKGNNKFQTFRKQLFEKYYYGTLFFKKSILKIETTEWLFKKLFGNKTFEDLKIPFVCNSLDINSGNEIIFNTGPLYKAIWASCAIPGIFPPFIEGDRILIDGGTINNIPLEPLLRMGARITIAVYLGDAPRFGHKPDTGFFITQRALSFMKYHLDYRILKLADCIIKPEVSEYHWADFSQFDALLQKGREGVEEKNKELKKITGFWYKIKKGLKPQPLLAI
ncbi:MAG: patatin-like phospholipase family protein [candidate division WOR-3 bacterium]